MSLESYLAFLLVAAVLAVTPGPDTVLAVRFAALGRVTGLSAALGTTASIFVWAALAALGVSALLRSSDLAYGTLNVLGGLYLAVLGAQVVHGLLARRSGVAAGRRVLAVAPPRPAKAFWTGVLTCLTNPKTGLFFLALLPQFAPVDAHPLFVAGVLGGTVALVVLLYLVVVVLVVDAAGQRSARPGVAVAVEAASGAALLVLGVAMVVAGVLDLVRVLSS